MQIYFYCRLAVSRPASHPYKNTCHPQGESQRSKTGVDHWRRRREHPQHGRPPRSQPNLPPGKPRACERARHFQRHPLPGKESSSRCTNVGRCLGGRSSQGGIACKLICLILCSCFAFAQGHLPADRNHTCQEVALRVPAATLTVPYPPAEHVSAASISSPQKVYSRRVPLVQDLSLAAQHAPQQGFLRPASYRGHGDWLHTLPGRWGNRLA